MSAKEAGERTMGTRYQILEAANAFLKAIKDAPPVEFDAAYQVLANRTNDSIYAYTHEPHNGLVVAMQAQARQASLYDEKMTDEVIAADEAWLTSKVSP